jgi:hypothetical protein
MPAPETDALARLLARIEAILAGTAPPPGFRTSGAQVLGDSETVVSAVGAQAGCFPTPPAPGLEFALVDERGAGSMVYLVILGIAAVLAIVGLVTRPFLFEPIAALLCIVATRQTPNPRYTGGVAALIIVCFFVGAAIAASGGHPLY